MTMNMNYDKTVMTSKVESDKKSHLLHKKNHNINHNYDFVTFDF